MSDPVPSPQDYLDAARAFCLRRYNYPEDIYATADGRKRHIENDAASTVADNPALVAAVDSAFTAGVRRERAAIVAELRKVVAEQGGWLWYTLGETALEMVAQYLEVPSGLSRGTNPASTERTTP